MQINAKADKTQTYITYDISNNLTNYKKLVPGINVTSNTIGNSISFSYVPTLEEYNVSIIEDSPSSQNHIITDYNPTNWDGTLPNKATEIRLNPTNLIVIENLLGNTLGRICRLRNISRYPILLQNNVTLNGGFIFRTNTDTVLRPNKTMMFTCIGSQWIEFGDVKYYGFDYIDTFKTIVPDFPGTITFNNVNNVNMALPVKSSNFIFSAHTTLLTNYAFYYDGVFRLLTKNFHAPSTGTNLKFYTIGQFNRKNILNDSGCTILMQTKLIQPVMGTGVNSNLNMPVIVNGFTNFDLSYGYQSATNSYSTRVPNFNGGLFFIGVSGYNYSAVTQYNNNQSNVIDTGINYLNSLSLGVCVLTKNQNNNGEVIFYIRNNTTNRYTVFNKQILTNEILNSFPNLSIFSNNTNTTAYGVTIGQSSYVELRHISMLKD